MSDQTITFIILGAAVAVFVWNRLPVGVTALGVALSLWATGVVSIDQALEGFGSQTVVLIAALFVVAEGLDSAGITTWAGRFLQTHAGDSSARLMILLMVTVAILSALITPNGAAAAITPMVVILAIKSGVAPSKMLMPTAFAAHAGSLLVLTGSPVTLLVSAALDESTGSPLGFFDVTLVGVPLLVGTIAVTLLVASRLLPDRKPASLSRDLSTLPESLRGQYFGEEQLARLTVVQNSSFVGMSVRDLNASQLLSGAHVLHIVDQFGSPKEDPALAAGDSLVIRGSAEEIEQLAADPGLDIDRGTPAKPIEIGLITGEFGVAEAVITPRSAYIGTEVFPGMITDSGELVVLAVWKHGQPAGSEPVTLEAGDALLLQGSWPMLDEHTNDPNVLIVDSPDAIRRQAAPLGPKTKPAVSVMAGMIILLVSGVVPAVVACLLAAIAMVLLGVVTIPSAHRSISWSTLILVAGMIPLSTAITDTGAADTLAEGFLDLTGGANSVVVLVGLFLITAALGQMISNTATALIIIPVALSIALETGYSPLTLLMCVNVAAAAAVMTPVATPANMMVMEPGGYKFGDYWKFGLPVMMVYLLAAVLLVPLIWSL